MRLLQPADQREERDVEENRTPVEFLDDFLETRRLGALTQHFQDHIVALEKGCVKP